MEQILMGGGDVDFTITRVTADDAEALLEHLKTVGGETDNLTFGAEGLPVTVG